MRRQSLEKSDFHLGFFSENGFEPIQPLFQRKKRLLLGVHAHCHDYFVKKWQCPLDQADVANGDGVE
jgi:hypothetical protein